MSDLDELIAKIEAVKARPHEAAVDLVEGLTSAYLDDLISKKSTDELVMLTAKVANRRASLALSPSALEPVLGTCRQILSFGAAGLAVVVGFGLNISKFPLLAQKVLCIAGVFYIELMVVSLCVLLLFLLQSRYRYPYLYFDRIGNAWPYFYYSSISIETLPRSPIHLGGLVRGVKSYATDFARFSERVLEEGPRESFRSELQQYFLLVVYQAYRMQFAITLINFFTYGLLGSIVGLAVLLPLVLTRIF